MSILCLSCYFYASSSIFYCLYLMKRFAVSISSLNKGAFSSFILTMFAILSFWLTYFFLFLVWQVAALFSYTSWSLLYTSITLLCLLVRPVCIVIGLPLLKLRVVSPKFYSERRLLLWISSLSFFVLLDFGLLIKVWYFVLLQNVVFLGLRVEKRSDVCLTWILFGALVSRGIASMVVMGMV